MKAYKLVFLQIKVHFLENLSRLQMSFEHLPSWLQQGISVWNKGNIELENGSKVMAAATSSAFR